MKKSYISFESFHPKKGNKATKTQRVIEYERIYMKKKNIIKQQGQYNNKN